MITFYPKKHILKAQLKKLFASGVGIGDAKVNSLSIANGFPSMRIFQENMPAYEKIIINPSNKMEYHISGYGMSAEDGITRLIGETIERYAFLYARLNYPSSLHGNYLHMLADNKICVPIEYLNVLRSETISLLRSIGIPDLYEHYTDTSEIKWSEFTSLFGKQDIYVPETMAYVASGSYRAMSTGTATHISQEKALVSALIEVLQIHTFMCFWYNVIPAPRVSLDGDILSNLLKKIYPENSIFEFIVFDITNKNIGLPTFLTICKNKKTMFPYMTFGIQSGFDIEYTVLRSIMEAAAIFNSFPYMAPSRYDYINSLEINSLKKSINLDDNFYYWANINDIDAKVKTMDRLDNNNTVSLSQLVEQYGQGFSGDPIDELLRIVYGMSKYACFKDISDSNALNEGLYTVRVVIPECLPMCFGLYPFDNHPAIKNIGGIRNGYFPHPLP